MADSDGGQHPLTSQLLRRMLFEDDHVPVFICMGVPSGLSDSYGRQLGTYGACSEHSRGDVGTGVSGGCHDRVKQSTQTSNS